MLPDRCTAKWAVWRSIADVVTYVGVISSKGQTASAACFYCCDFVVFPVAGRADLFREADSR